MLYDRVMRNIQNRHKPIKHMNSLISARYQRKLRKVSEIHFKGHESWVPGPTFRVTVPTYMMGPGSWVSSLTNSSGSRVPLFGYALICLHKFLSFVKSFLNVPSFKKPLILKKCPLFKKSKNVNNTKVKWIDEWSCFFTNIYIYIYIYIKNKTFISRELYFCFFQTFEDSIK